MNILIGSAGGLTGQYLTKYYKKLGDEIYTADVSVLNYSATISKKHFLVPRFDDENTFLKSIIKIINDNKIELYIPTYSKEFEIISRNEKIIKKQCDVFFVVSPYETFASLADKVDCYKALEKIGVDCPKVYYEKPDEFPCFVKMRNGSGGRNARMVESSEELDSDLSEKYFCCEYLQGDEYTVDCLFDLEGELLAFNPRKRNKTLGGAVVISENVADLGFSEIIRRIASGYVFKGCVNFQFIVTESRSVCIDVNIRFPSGGLPLTVESGINIPAVMKCWANGIKPEKSLYKNDNKPRIMLRHFDESYILKSDLPEFSL